MPARKPLTVSELNNEAYRIVKRVDALSLALTRLDPSDQSDPAVLFMIDQTAEWIVATAHRLQMAARTPAGLVLLELVKIEDAAEELVQE